jgi:tRNA/tmRNA/rRNA uracil-C5-methylase (TrmA/RlmC/RlmD family)
LIDIEQCPISRDEINDALTELRAQSHIRDGHYTLRAGSGSRVFSQVNNDVAQALRDLIVDLVPPHQGLLIDAYCGAGFFAKALLDKFERVLGIDWDRFAIATAKQHATEKEVYLAGHVESELEKVGAVHLNRPAGANFSQTGRSGLMAPSTIMVDPPATGMSEGVRKAIINLAPETLIYVSCNPPTLARDLKDLREKFTINSVTPLDMFPQTAEVEVLVHLHA